MAYGQFPQQQMPQPQQMMPQQFGQPQQTVMFGQPAPMQQFGQPQQGFPQQPQPQQFNGGQQWNQQPANGNPGNLWNTSKGGGKPRVTEFIGNATTITAQPNAQGKLQILWQGTDHMGQPWKKGWSVGKDFQVDYQNGRVFDPQNAGREVNENTGLGILMRCIKEGAPLDLRAALQALVARGTGPLQFATWQGLRWHFLQIQIQYQEGQVFRPTLFPIALLGNVTDPLPQGFQWKTLGHTLQGAQQQAASGYQIPSFSIAVPGQSYGQGQQGQGQPQQQMPQPMQQQPQQMQPQPQMGFTPQQVPQQQGNFQAVAPGQPQPQMQPQMGQPQMMPAPMQPQPMQQQPMQQFPQQPVMQQQFPQQGGMMPAPGQGFPQQ